MKRRVARPIAGSYSLVVQPRPSARWASPGVPEFDPNWVARFSLPGRPVKVESTRLPVCDGCLADRGAKRPLREKCACRALAAEWADVKLGVMAELWHQGRLDELRGMVKPREVKRLALTRVLEVYATASVETRADNMAALKFVYETATGKLVKDGFVDEVTPALLRRFAAVYQEYGRKGWAKRGVGPVDAFAQVRAMKPQPALDWETAASWNTTIRSNIGRLKSIFGPESREKYIHTLADELPDMTALREFSMALPKPDNRDAMSQEQFLAMVEALTGLRTHDVRMWLMIRMAMATGLRSVELQAIRRDWLEVDGSGQVLLVVKQRAESKLKDRKSKQVREIPLPADVVEEITKLLADSKPADSIYGLETQAMVDALYRRVNAWLRAGGYVSESSDQVLYVVGRKTRATAQARAHGLQAAADALGHATNSTTAAYYVEPTVRVTPMTVQETADALRAGRKPLEFKSSEPGSKTS